MNWPELDEDISVEGLIAGERSAESESSFQRWLKAYSGGQTHSVNRKEAEGRSIE